MLCVTMGVSYLLSVLGAVSIKRSFASSVTGMEINSESVVRSGWDGDSFDELRTHGAPTVSDGEFADSLDGLADRRGLLLGVVNADSWDWPPEKT